MAEHEDRDSWLLRGTDDASAVARQYDAWAEGYEDDLASWSYRAPDVVAARVLTGRPTAQSILDVGCGTGLVGRALRAKGYAGSLTGLDISRASLRVAEQAGAYTTLAATDLQQRLPLDDESVDALVCVGVMTYLVDVESVWREFARVTRAQGLVVVTQREDFRVPRECQAVIDRLEADGLCQPVEVHGPAPYLPTASGAMADLGAYYVTLEVL